MGDVTVAKKKYQELLSQGQPLDMIIQHMRADGLTKIDSIRVLVDSGYSLQEAKKLVHLSEVWADTRARDDEFHDALIKNFEELSDDEDVDPSTQIDRDSC